MKKFLPLLLALFAALAGVEYLRAPADSHAPATQEYANETYDEAGEALLQQAYEARRSDVQVQASGRVVKLLPDDNRGSRHQRFLVEMRTGLTVLIAHNIDLAPRVNDLAEGDTLRFNGEYEWNDKGGVIHWTHHDPKGRHVGGWLKHQGEIYQ